MDFNSLPSTTFTDIRGALETARRRVKGRLGT
jgi:hypothetical protein